MVKDHTKTVSELVKFIEIRLYWVNWHHTKNVKWGNRWAGYFFNTIFKYENGILNSKGGIKATDIYFTPGLGFRV